MRGLSALRVYKRFTAIMPVRILIYFCFTVLLSCKNIPDKDRDGIPDAIDQCDSAPNEPVDGTGCACAIQQDSMAVGHVRFFIDNSGSMKQLAGDTSVLRLTLSSVLRNIRYASEQKKISGDGYYFVSNKSQKTTYDQFYENLKTGRSLTATSSPLMKMIESLLSQHDKNGISVLVSDCELVDQNEDVQDLAFRNESIKRYSKDGSLIIYRLHDVNKNKYFYLMAFGRSGPLGWFDTKIMTETYVDKADFGLTYGALDFQILNYTGRKGIWYTNSHCRTIEQIDFADSGSVTIGLAINLAMLPANFQSTQYLNNNITLLNVAQKSATFDVFKISEMEIDKDDRVHIEKSATHIVLLTLQKGINSNDIVFGTTRQVPAWIKVLGNDSGRNLLLGINEAFSDADNNYFSMKLTIN